MKIQTVGARYDVQGRTNTAVAYVRMDSIGANELFSISLCLTSTRLT